MPDKINTLFRQKKKNILSVYFTAGYPALEDTASIINVLIESRVEMIEIGIPFSDPLADGPTIQRSSEIALSNGMNLQRLFHHLAAIKTTIKNSPTAFLLMGYLNPVLKFGMEKFLKNCRDIGISGTIIPDMPADYFKRNYLELYRKHEIKNIFLITPQTPVNRIRWIDRISDGFIYAVSSAATTGKILEINGVTTAYFKRLKSLNLKNPIMIGFGISDRKSFQLACSCGSGAIIGSAFVKMLSNSDNLSGDIKNFVAEMR